MRLRGRYWDGLVFHKSEQAQTARVARTRVRLGPEGTCREPLRRVLCKAGTWLPRTLSNQGSFLTAGALACVKHQKDQTVADAHLPDARVTTQGRHRARGTGIAALPACRPTRSADFPSCSWGTGRGCCSRGSCAKEMYYFASEHSSCQ